MHFICIVIILYTYIEKFEAVGARKREMARVGERELRRMEHPEHEAVLGVFTAANDASARRHAPSVARGEESIRS